MAKAKVEQASRALQRIKEFQPDAVTLAEAEGALSAAESALKTECESLQDSFVSLLQQALAVPGVSSGDVSGLHVDELKSRVSRLEQRAQQPAPGLTEEEIKAFVKASTPTTTSPVTPTLKEDEIRALVRKEGVTEERVREIAKASNTGLNEVQVRAIVAKITPSEDRVREIVQASATGLNEEQVRTVVKKNAPAGLSDEHIKALIRLNAPTLDQVKDIVKASIPTTLTAPAVPPSAASSVQASPAPPPQVAISAPAPTQATETKAEPKAEDVKGEPAAGARPQIKLRALLSEVLQRVEAVESALDERYERLQGDIDEQRYDLNQAVGRYELAAARRAALPPGESAGHSLEGTPAPAPVAPAAKPAPATAPAPANTPANSAPNSEIALLKAQMDAMRAQLSAVTSEVSALRTEVATLKMTPSNAQAPNAKPAAPAAMGAEFDAKMAGWKTAILKDIEDWIHAKLPGIIAPILEDMKGKVLAQMLVEARAGGMGAAQNAPRVNSPSGRFAPQAQHAQQYPQPQTYQQQGYGYQPYQHR
ncbi:hypothetical protein A1Q2_03597 [Trichosporon asahii var. asahii CBS 8904]|uniref:Uncharacterized protein n=2 Tax=Trichosporon asahii var. asahii TaxID=189963 RepID=K1VDP5_TRIAC|nr:hypothetical protein A1Q1_05260 [Trichosporon asahii var. asahii CBS 2479]EJT53297.1 hypothetical protein A1Q1_05260 [Trichosporon asahii var. asahii CBS 2479]EKD02095.1 hypothetical protein A1Q2_03597 [Trichosporon asahii var. asahii CBS 8904]